MKRATYFAAASFLLAFAQALYAQSPPAPFNLMAHATSTLPQQVELTWQFDLPPMSMFHIFFVVSRSDDDSTHFQAIAVVTSQGYHDWHVQSGHTYFYSVKAVLFTDTGALESGPSNTAWATVGPGIASAHGVIDGTVTDSATGNPVPLVRILFFRISSPRAWIPNVITGPEGKYRAVLDTGTYLLRAEPVLVPVMWMILPFPIYLPEWYNDVLEIADATPVVVADSSQFTADFHLKRFHVAPLVSLSGTVTDTSGHPLKGALVVVLRTFREMEDLDAWGGEVPGFDDDNLDIDDIGHVRGVLWKGLTDSLGDYTAHVLGGKSYIAFAAKRGYLPQFFDHKSDFRDADIIHLNGDTSGINFSLTPRPVATGSISGVVQDSTGVRVRSRIILISVSRPLSGRFASTDSDGAYDLTAVRAGDYFVLAIPYTGYAPAFYKAGAFGVFHWQDADTVHVGSSAVTGIDIGVVPISGGGMATIAGIVQSQGNPVAGANVVAADNRGTIVGYSLTDNTGSYVLDAIPPGTITVIVDNAGYLPATSTVNVELAQGAVSGANFSIDPVNATSVPPGQSNLPTQYALEQNYPNPFNPSTRIGFTLPAAGNVTLRVFNLLGQEIATIVNAVLPAGRHEVVWGGSDNAGRPVASGVYFYKLEASAQADGQQFTAFRKMVLLK